MENKRECEHCHQPFFSAKTSKFCSEKECKKSRLKKSYLKNRAARLAYARKYIRKIWAVKKFKKELSCVVCQIKFNRQLRGYASKTCSTECSFQLKKQLGKRRNDTNYKKQCDFKKLKQNNFCCLEAFIHLNNPHCAYCNKSFKKTSNKKFCSLECREQKYNQFSKKLRAEFTQKQTAYKTTPLRILTYEQQ